MRKLLRFTSLAAGAFMAVSQMCQTATAQMLFSEDFEGVPGGGFPAGWARFNVDGLTPATAVSYVTDAWIVRDDFIAPVTAGDSSAFSTSWYSPVGTSNDWMISPGVALAANCRLNWRALAPDPSYPDGYEVWCGTTQSVAGMTTKLMTVAAENQVWTNRYVDLDSAGLTSGTYYFAWRNNSTDEFILLVDDIEVEAIVALDAEVLDVDLPDTSYTIIPATQTRPLLLGGTVNNNGLSSLSSVSLNVNVYDGSMSVVSTDASLPIASLAPGASVHINLTSWTPPAGVADFYTFEYFVTHGTTDGNPANDTMYTGMLISDSTFARDNGIIAGGVGIGAGEGGYLGQDFVLVNDDYLTTVDVAYSRGFTGEPHALAVWDMAGGTPNAIIAVTDTLTYPNDSLLVVTYNLSGGPIFLPAGTYAFTAIEFDSTVQVAQSSDIFNYGHTWVNWPSSPLGGWGNMEEFGPTFQRASIIRPNLVDFAVVSAQDAKPQGGTLRAYPNPSNGTFTLEADLGSNAPAHIEIFDVRGRVVFTSDEASSIFKRELSLSHLTAGSYFVKVRSENGVRVAPVIIK